MNDDNNNTIKTHVPDRGISEITLRNLERYDDAALLAKTGMPSDPNFAPRNYNEKTLNRFEGLNLMISLQQHIISTNNMATVEKNCYNTWNRKYKLEEKKRDNLFGDEDNDINELKAILLFLNTCEQKIEISRRTKTQKDDFYLEKEDSFGKKTIELTDHFFKMNNELIDSYRSIYTILLDHKIVTLGNEEDKDVTEDEKEKEVRRRILQA